MKFFSFILTSFCFYCIDGFLHTISTKKMYDSHLRMDANADFFTDTNLIHNYKMNIAKENYNNMVDNLINNKLSRLYINTNYKEVVSVDNVHDFMLYKHYHISNIDPAVVPNLVAKTSEMHVPLYFFNFTPANIVNLQHFLGELLNIVSYMLPVFILLSFISGISQMVGGDNSMPNFNQNKRNNFMPLNKSFQKGNKIERVDLNVTLNDWAGSPELIDECREIISYLANKELYQKIGAEMPKGILLEGPPGTGKTLLAKAIATETNSSFISVSGSEFVELFVGMGASRVRELFNTARQHSPCIIFIDEIDAVGRQRGAGINMANDEREQTLNQILYEMDGFQNNEGIVVMGATNRKDVLDQALLRPGRFDRIVKISLPDKKSREQILEHYLANKTLDNPFNIPAIAELTDGFSGAQLKNLINEAAIMSVKNNYTTIQENYMYDAFEKLLVGLVKRNADVGHITKRRVAVHESGHAILALYFKDYFDLNKVSIQPTYNGAGGYTIFTEKPEIKEGGLYTKDVLKKRLIISMGGKAAENIVYGNDYVTLGATEDLKQANKLAQRMVSNFGMGDKLEVFFNEETGDDTNPFLGRSLSVGNKHSQYIKHLVDKESLDLVREAYTEAKKILSINRSRLSKLVELLEEKNVVYKKDMDNDILNNIK